MWWWVAAMLICFATGIVTLAAAAEPRGRMQTFSHPSLAGREFDRRASWLLVIRFTSAGMLILMGLVCVVAGLELML